MQKIRGIPTFSRSVFFLQYVNTLIFSLLCDLFAKPHPKICNCPITAASIQETAVLYKSD